jgi:hypothetical protein
MEKKKLIIKLISTTYMIKYIFLPKMYIYLNKIFLIFFQIELHTHDDSLEFSFKHMIHK